MLSHLRNEEVTFLKYLGTRFGDFDQFICEGFHKILILNTEGRKRKESEVEVRRLKTFKRHLATKQDLE